MNTSILTIPLLNLSLAFVPVIIVLGILYKWSLKSHTALYAVMRMLVQLILVGYVLTYVFATDSPYIVILILTIMLTASGFISLRSVSNQSRASYLHLMIAISIGSLSTLFFITGVVLQISPWYLPQYLIPLAGMTIASCMNSVSLAAERYESELSNDNNPIEARRTAMNACLIPNINTLFAVGIVSLPGMMTGQILSGVDPLIAVRYQIVVMCMVFGCSGMTSACYLLIASHSKTEDKSAIY
ncbi:MAG: ABC transporter permease [Gammaproteobacteria bacterium]|nr:ABC transporter permease [Gammaproteobacteria bacterium]